MRGALVTGHWSLVIGHFVGGLDLGIGMGIAVASLFAHGADN